MSSSSRDHLVVNKKRGRRDISSGGTSYHHASSGHDALSSIDTNERATELSNKLLSLDEEFPEVKCIARVETLLETTVKTHREAMQEANKKRKFQSITNHREESGTLYSLPDEVLQNCLMYVGKGHYGLVALVSKKLHEAYKIKFGNETAFLEMATSVKLATYCLNELCRMTKDKDEMLSHYDEIEYGDLDESELAELEKVAEDVYFTDEDEKQTTWSKKIVKLSKLVERGHLHVLQFLHEELNYKVGLQSPTGNVKALNWLLSKGFDFEEVSMDDAIRSKSTEMIQICFDFGLADEGFSWDEEPIRETKSLDVYRKVQELGYDFKELEKY